MTKETSIYLDIVRFIAACVVFISHAYGENITGGFLWQIGAYAQTAVMIFFVLSGYVISYISDTKETRFEDYAISRISRLYSVVIPALLITMVCNHIVNAYSTGEYVGPWQKETDTASLRYLLSLFMLQDVWSIDLSPLNNGSFWSLSYEFFYYALFAAVFFARGLARIAIFTAAALVAGPSILSLFPIWCLGYLAYKFNKNIGYQLKLKPIACYLLYITSLALLIVSPYHREALEIESQVFRQSVVSDFIDGLAFFIHLMSLQHITTKLSPCLLPISRQVAYFASLTFSLYLLHLPILRLSANFSPFIAEPASWENITFIYLVTFSVILVVGRHIENTKYWYKRNLVAIADKLRNSGSAKQRSGS